MKILVLEDDGSIAIAIKRNFEPKHTVFLAYSIYDAIEIKEVEEPDLYIIDLNLDPDGLEEKEIDETQGGIFTGWVFIKNYLFQEGNNLRPNAKIVIYSDFLNQFRKFIKDKKDLETIILFDKTDDTADDIVKSIKQIIG